MKFGVQVMRFDWPGSPDNIATTLGDIAEFCDEAELDSLWVMDHFFQMGGSAGEPSAPMLEAYTTLGYLAGRTSNITLGALVTGYLYRYPGILGKTITTLDVLSQGRAWFGIGAGWYQEEADGLGVPFEPTTVRFEQLEETLQIVQQMWSGHVEPFRGTHYQLAEPINQPPSVQKPHPPIMVGGEGRQMTLRLVARYAQARNFYFGVTDPALGAWHHERFLESEGHLEDMWAMLGERCDEVGRDRSEIEFTALGTVRPDRSGTGDSPEFLLDYFGRLGELGVEHIIVNLSEPQDVSQLEVVAEVAAKMR